MKIVIDFGVIAYRIRLAAWPLLRRWLARHGRCQWCGVHLTPSERKYYDNTCERCEGRWMAAIKGDARS